MKLKYTFDTVELDGEIMAIPVGADTEDLHIMLRLNSTAADILSLLKEETTESQIIEAMMKEYSVDISTITNHVHDFINTLKAANVLE